MTQAAESSPPALLFFDGPYGNLPALIALRAIAAELALPPQAIICTGDTVAYCAQPRQTIAAIRNWGIRVIAGNVERQLADNAGDCGCNFIEGKHLRPAFRRVVCVCPRASHR